MMIVVSAKDEVEDQVDPATAAESFERKVGLLEDAWIQGLSSDDEVIAAEKHLERFGAPFLSVS